MSNTENKDNSKVAPHLRKYKDVATAMVNNIAPNAPHLNQQFDWRVYDGENELYENSGSLGLAKEINVLSGASNDTVIKLAEIIKATLKDGKKYHYQFTMAGDYKIQDQLAKNALAHAQLSDSAADRAMMMKDYYEMCAVKGFPTRLGKSARLDLKNYRSFFFITAKTKDKSAVKNLSDDIDSRFSTEGFETRNISPSEFISYVRNILNHDTSQMMPSKYKYNEYDYLCAQVAHFNTRIIDITPYYIDMVFDGVERRVMALSLSKLPNTMHLAEMPEYLADTEQVGTSLTCPFLLSTSFKIEEQAISDEQVKSKIASLSKWANSAMAKFMPQVGKELADYQEIQQGIMDDQFKLCNVHMDMLLFSTKETWRDDLNQAKTLFKNIGMTSTECMQIQVLLSVLPFHGIKYFDDIKKSGRIQRLKSGNIANMLPIVADWKGVGSGLLMPSAHNQIAFVNNFEMYVDNYNTIVVGGSGSGKSVFTQMLLRSGLDRGATVYIQDNGRSHEKFTTSNGGTYMDYKNLRLNPFAELDRDAIMAIDPEEGAATFANQINLIASLIATMASPEGQSMTDFRFAVIRDAVSMTYERTGRKSKIDDVIESIKMIMDSDELYGKDRRVSDLLMELKPFSSNGDFGQTFNDVSMLRDDQNLFCLEMGGFDERILNVVLLANFVYLSNRIYLNHDSKWKYLALEEFWKYARSTNAFIQEAIVKALRTFRKHSAALVVITQNVSDFFNGSQFSKDIWDISDVKFVLKQDSSFKAVKVDKETGVNDYGFNRWEIEHIGRFKPSKDTGYSSLLIKTGTSSSVHRLFLSPIDKIATSTHAKEVQYLMDLRGQGFGIDEAIERAAWHFYPQEMKELELYRANKYGMEGSEDA